MVDKYGLRTDPEKVECIANYEKPRTMKELRRFMGMTSYYRKFIQNFAGIAAPLHELTKSKARILKWNQKAEMAFSKLKSVLIQAPVLASPDFAKKFSIQCDASDHSICGVISQFNQEKQAEQPIAFVSRKLRGAELNYTTTEKVCLAVIFALEKFGQYIDGAETFDVLTDHSALLWLFRQSDLKGRLARWIMKIQQYNFEIKHVKGKNNTVPDAISRFPNENIALIEIKPVDSDDWYDELYKKIEQNPKKFANYKLNDRKIFIKLNKKDENPEFEYKLIVPKSKRIAVLKECHDKPTAAHLGVYKTIKRVLQKYYWPGVIGDVKEYVKNCKICLQSKTTTKKPFGQMGKMKIATQPWEVVSMDLMGPFVRSTKGNDHLLVITDYFSKYPILMPLRNAKANKIVEVVENKLFLEQGIPKTVIVDNGKQFVSKNFKQLLKSYDVPNIMYNCVYHPQNNPTERVNKVIGAALRSYITDNHKKWDVEIYRIATAIRTATNIVTGFTPFYLNHGREYISSGTDYILKYLSDRDADQIASQQNKLEQLAMVTNTIIDKMQRAYKINKQYYDKNKIKISFKVGDKVYRRNFALSDASKNFSAKLAPKYLECKIVEKISDLAYRLRDEKGGENVYHVKDIKHV